MIKQMPWLWLEPYTTQSAGKDHRVAFGPLAGGNFDGLTYLFTRFSVVFGVLFINASTLCGRLEKGLDMGRDVAWGWWIEARLILIVEYKWQPSDSYYAQSNELLYD